MQSSGTIAFFLRTSIAFSAIGIVLLAYAMLHGIPVNGAYHEAVRSEIQSNSALGKSMTYSEVQKIEKKYSYLAETDLTTARMIEYSAKETIAFTALIFLLSFYGQHRNWLHILFLAAFLFSLQGPLHIIDATVAIVWLLASILATSTKPASDSAASATNAAQ